MAEPEKVQMYVTVTVDGDQVNVDLDPEDVIAMRADDTIDKVGITLAGEPIALLQRFAGPMPGNGNAGLN